MSERWGVTDSPWFWVATFSAMALLGLFVVGPKYAVREASWEQKLLTRGGIQRPEQATGGQDTGETPVAPQTASTGETTVPQEMPAEPKVLVPLWRLKVVSAVVWLVACAMLWRQVHQRRATERRSP